MLLFWRTLRIKLKENFQRGIYTDTKYMWNQKNKNEAVFINVFDSVPLYVSTRQQWYQ